MEILKQLAVFVANRPGTLARVCRILSEHDINILGLAVADSVDHAVLRFVVDKATPAIHALGEAGLLTVDSEIFAIRLSNKTGRLADLGQALSDVGVNIEYAYGGVSGNDQEGTLYIKVSDPAKALPVFTRQRL